jgi:hypothetical protein
MDIKVITICGSMRYSKEMIKIAGIKKWICGYSMCL